jgi:hypothetical protein
MHKRRFGNAVTETTALEPGWKGPVLSGRGRSSEGGIFLTDAPVIETSDFPSDEWDYHWGSPAASETISKPDRGHVIVVQIRLTACFAESWTNLSVLAKSYNWLLASHSDLIGKSWNLPTLTDRSGDESGVTVEAQMDRLECCAGKAAAELVRNELEHQISGEEEEPVTVPIDALRRLVDFLCAHPRLKIPHIFISDDKLKAQWQASSEQIAWIEFEATEHVRVLAFYPEPKALGGVKRFVGHSTVQAAYLDLHRLGVDWIAR